jgi:hypothetical protein
VHLSGFITQLYHDAQSHERQIAHVVYLVSISEMILLLLLQCWELLLNNALKKTKLCAFSSCLLWDWLPCKFFSQTNHLRKFLEFRVGLGIVYNMVAKCKYVIVVVLVQLMELIFSNLKWCNVLHSLQILLLWLAFIQWVFPFLLLGTHFWQDVGRKRDSGWVLALSTDLLFFYNSG